MAAEELPQGVGTGEQVKGAVTAAGEAEPAANPNSGEVAPAGSTAGWIDVTLPEENEEPLVEVGEGEEGDGEDEGGEGALLGFAVEPQEKWSLARWRFPSKCGGVPAYLEPRALPKGADMRCDFCEEPLTFFLQVYAPRDSEPSAFHRTAFVFSCERQQCLKRQAEEQGQWAARASTERQESQAFKCAVKAFRCQLDRENPFYSFDAPPKHKAGAPLTSQAPLCVWCATWLAEKRCSKCKGAAYCSREHQVAHWKAGHKEACTPSDTPSVPSQEVGAVPVPVRASGLWKEHELVVDEEPPEGEASTKEEELLEECRRRAAAEGEYSAAELEGFSTRKDGDGAPSADELNWLQFQTRISRAPSQVLRYYQDGCSHPLLAVTTLRPPTAAEAPHCPDCRSPRHVECQILPQILHLMDIGNEPDSLDFASVFIYTCEASCKGQGTPYMREMTWVQLYRTDTQ